MDTFTEEIEYIDNFILGVKDLEEYDMEATYYNVIDKIRNLKKARSIYIHGYHLRLNSNYQPIFVSSGYTPSDKVGNAVENKLDSEQEYNEFNYHLSKLYETMSIAERAYINDCLINNKSENSVKEKFNIPRRHFEDIKLSSIARFALAFNLIEYK